MPEGFLFFENLRSINNNINLAGGMFNSLIYATFGALCAVIISLFAAFGIAHLKIKFKMFWFLLIYSGTIFPFQIYLIPVFRGFTVTGLHDTRFGMVLFYTAICIPFAMFVLRNFFTGISKELMESARIDGAGNLSILFKIFAPMSIAPLSVVFLAQFNWAWNELMFGMAFTRSSDIRPVMAQIAMLTTNVPEMLVAALVASLPTVILFAILHKNFEAGFAYQGK
jgi:multiple sugar transport system permease protein